MTTTAATYTFKVNDFDSDMHVHTTTVTALVIFENHCQQCGSTDRKDVETLDDDDLQGYTACCNERVVDGGSCATFDDCSHS
jgi:hypothetical protein